MGAAVKWFGGVAAAVLLLPLAIALILMGVLMPGINKALEPQCGVGAGGGYAGGTMVAGGWTVPMGEPYILRSPFGMRFHPIYHEWRMHQGVDIISSVSDASPIISVHDGVVSWTRYGTTDAGNNVNVDHGGGIVTRYMHLKEIKVSVGQRVTAGQVLGIEGTTGASTGEHLHFEYRTGANPANPTSGTPIDPVAALEAYGIVWDGKPGGPVAAPTAPAATPASASGAALSVAKPAPGVEAGFQLPEPGEPRYVSLQNAPIQPSAEIRSYYDKAAAASGLPWTLLAGVGMEETEQGTQIKPHPAGARGIMQFLPSTWAEEGRDGDGDGRADIDNPADSIMSAAFYLVKNGARNGPDGVKAALRVYNPRDFYLNDVLYYAKAYGSGSVVAGGAPNGCPPAAGGVGLILDGTETTVRAHLTGYDWWDNAPPQSAEIAYHTVHSQAGGAGTYDDPITAAVSEKYPAGTRFYMPNVHRYFVVEDAGDSGMLHPPAGTDIWIDQWVGGQDVSRDASQACAGKVTGDSTVVVNPKPGYPVAPGFGINHDGICDAGYGDAVPAAAAPK